MKLAVDALGLEDEFGYRRVVDGLDFGFLPVIAGRAFVCGLWRSVADRVHAFSLEPVASPGYMVALHTIMASAALMLLAEPVMRAAPRLSRLPFQTLAATLRG